MSRFVTKIFTDFVLSCMQAEENHLRKISNKLLDKYSGDRRARKLRIYTALSNSELTYSKSSIFKAFAYKAFSRTNAL